MIKKMIHSSLLICLSFHLSTAHPVLDEMRRQFVNPHEVNNLNLADSRIQDVYSLKSSVNNLTKTISKIQNLVNINPQLPRLTKGELLDMMENVTNAQGKVAENRTRKRVMIVMPFTPNKVEQVQMEDLYTKPPITTMIGEMVKHKNNTIKRIIKRKRRPFDKSTVRYEATTITTPTPTRPPYKKYNRISNRNSDSSQKPISSISSTTQDPTLITFKSFIEEFTTPTPIQQFPVYQPTTSTEISVVTKSSQALYNIVKRRRRPTELPTATQQGYPEGPRPVLTNQVLKMLNAPDLTPSKPEKLDPTPTPKSYLRRRTRPSTTSPPPSPPPSTTTQPKTTTAPSTTTTPRPYQRYPFPVISSAKPFELPQPTPQTVTNNFILPDHLKYTLDELNVDHPFNNIPINYNSVNYEQPHVPEDVKNILDSFVVYSHTTTSSPNIEDVAENLNPDMKELLMSFGLLPNPDQADPVEDDRDQFSLEASSTVNRNAYAQFKPLPEGAPVMNDMQEFLDRFGLGRHVRSQRQPKAFSLEKQDTGLDEVPSVEVGMLPDSLKDIMNDLGIFERNNSAQNDSSERTSKRIRSELIEKILEKPQESKVFKKHIFRPTEVPYAEEELNKLNQLIDIIKQLEKLNKTATEEDFSKDDLRNLTELVGSLNDEQAALHLGEDQNLTEIIESFTKQSKPLDQQGWGPDPLNFDLGLAKNEVKRQENSTSTTAGVEIVTPSATITTTAGVEALSNIKELEESFGGSVEASDTDSATVPPPAVSTPNTGFYYLLDWNSFLEIDDQKGKRVNLRLQPKVGDPKKFLSVTVP